MSGYADQLRPLSLRLASSFPSLINDFACKIYRYHKEISTFLLLPILPLGTQPIPVYAMAPILTGTSAEYVIEWQPQGMLIASPQTGIYQTVTGQQMQQWCCVVGNNLFCHPQLLPLRVHASCSQELLRGLTVTETALACYDSFLLRNPYEIHVVKYDDNRFYVHTPSTRQVPVYCNGR